MPLQGKAKTRYQRDYMRKPRTDLPTAKPRPPKPVAGEAGAGTAAGETVLVLLASRERGENDQRY